MLRKILLPAFVIATLAGCATGYSYRSGNGGDYYYGEPNVEYRYYGGYGYYGSYGYGYGGYGYYGLGRPWYGYPYGYYGGAYPSYPYGHGPRPPHGPGHGHDGGHDGDHDGPPPPQDGHRPGNRPPWRDIGRIRDREEGEVAWSRRDHQSEAPSRMHAPAPRRASPAPVERERTESRPSSRGARGGGDGGRSRVRAARPSADD
ncbi:MAG TPA: hypothetical protein VLC71_01090 [Thermomonas sp.]|nr:hypothetical protein [Thermomonas sp.]